VDVVLLDTTFWGGIRPCIKAAGVCETFQLGVAVQSSGLAGDIIAGGKLEYADCAMAVPAGPGLGVRLDRDKPREYAELCRPRSFRRPGAGGSLLTKGLAHRGAKRLWWYIK
jgi:glucarate dehydratase